MTKRNRLLTKTALKVLLFLLKLVSRAIENYLFALSVRRIEVDHSKKLILEWSIHRWAS